MSFSSESRSRWCAGLCGHHSSLRQLLGILAALCCALLGSQLNSVQLRAQTADGTSTTAANPTVQAAQVQQLVERLGSDQFAQREAASAELLKMGESALIPLSVAEQGKDLEVRGRARAIRERIERAKFEGIIQNFKRDPDPTADYGLPGWKSFSKVAGTTRPAKRLFLDMIEQRRIVAMCLEAIDGGELPEGVFEGLPADPQTRLRAVISTTCKDVRYSLLTAGEEAKTGDLVALLVAASVMENPSADLHDALRIQCNMGGLASLMALPSSRGCARKLLGGWFRRAPVSLALELFTVARLHQIPDAAHMARRALTVPTDDDVKSAALVVLSNFGGPDDLPLIDKFVDDQKVLDEFIAQNVDDDIRVEELAPPLLRPNTGPGNRPRSQRLLGDVALMAGLRIAGADLPTLFPGIRVEETFGVRESTIGFPVDKPELRATARKAYREFRASSNPPAS